MMKTILMKELIILVLISTAFLARGQAPLPRLEISSNKRFFQTPDGKPFFWLGDTGWLLFVKCDRQQAINYLETRQQQGFNVVQVMVLHELKRAKNKYGDSALVNLDASRPLTTGGHNANNAKEYDYWDHVDFIIDEAARRGIYMALVPVWGSNVKEGMVTVQQAEAYARFLAERYKNKTNIIWLNGGDIRGTEGEAVWKTIGITLKKYTPQQLVTFHPRGRHSSSEWFHSENWLDFNMFQSGHRTYAQDTSKADPWHYGEDNWKYITKDYTLTPTKPTLDGEPSYENIPHGLHDTALPRWTAADLRRYAYWSVFAGGAGFTYGENAVMQFHTPGDKDANYGVNIDWITGLQAPGAAQLRHLKELLLSKSYFDRVPAQEILVNNTGTRYDYNIATKGKQYALVYTYTGNNFTIDRSKISFPIKSLQWFHPADGKRSTITTKGDGNLMEFDPPGEPGSGNDWVLIIE